MSFAQPSEVANQLGIAFLVNFSTYPRDCVSDYALTSLGGGYVPEAGNDGVGLSCLNGTLRGFATKNNPTELQFQSTTIFAVFVSTGGGNEGSLLLRSMGSANQSWGMTIYRGSNDFYTFSINGTTTDGGGAIAPSEGDGFFNPAIGAHAVVASIENGSLYCTSNKKDYPTPLTYSGNIDYSRTDLGIVINATKLQTANNFTGILYACGIFNRALTQSERLFVANNPWQLFAPRPSRFILIPDGAGGGGSFSSTSSLDALIQKTFSSSTALDALIQSAFNSSISLDSLIAAVKNNTITFDALLQSTKNSTVSVDALLQLVKSGSVSVDALIQLTLSRAISVDALIQATNNKVTSLDALIQATKNGSISFDALITGATGTFANLSLDALIQAIKNQTISLDALIQKQYSSTIALDSYVALVGTRTVSLDALIQLTRSGVVSIDALIQMSKNTFVSFDALIQSAKSGMISLDAILTLATNVSVFLDAYVQKTLSRGVSLDAIIGAIADMIMPIGRVISVNQSNRLVSISNSERMISIQ